MSPLPEGDLADQAAAYLRRLHGECYGDPVAIRGDLAQPPPPSPLQPENPWRGGMHGGFPPTGNAPVFLRVFTLLRHLLQQPFDQAEGVPLPEHLIERTEAIPGAYLPSEAATLRKDLEKLLTPYGFRPRNDNVRHGYAIGTALLSAHRLREIHGVVSRASGRLADPSAQDLLRIDPPRTVHSKQIEVQVHLFGLVAQSFLRQCLRA